MRHGGGFVRRGRGPAGASASLTARPERLEASAAPGWTAASGSRRAVRAHAVTTLCLGGFRFGAVVAFEMARQLEARGESSLLVMPDIMPPQQKWRRACGVQALRALGAHLRELASARPDKRKLALRRSLRPCRERLSERSGSEAVGLEDVVDLQAYPPDYVPAAKAHREALKRYRLDVLNGTAVLFRPAGSPVRSACDPITAGASWSMVGCR